MVNSADPSEGGGCTPSPFHSIYHHDQSCGVRSSWEGRYRTLPLFLLYPFLLCDWYYCHCSCDWLWPWLQLSLPLYCRCCCFDVSSLLYLDVDRRRHQLLEQLTLSSCYQTQSCFLCSSYRGHWCFHCYSLPYRIEWVGTFEDIKTMNLSCPEKASLLYCSICDFYCRGQQIGQRSVNITGVSWWMMQSLHCQNTLQSTLLSIWPVFLLKCPSLHFCSLSLLQTLFRLCPSEFVFHCVFFTFCWVSFKN